MARRPDFWKREDILSRQDLKSLADRLGQMRQSVVREFYDRAYRECRIVNNSTFPTARALQELVQAWKQLRKWRR